MLPRREIEVGTLLRGSVTTGEGKASGFGNRRLGGSRKADDDEYKSLKRRKKPTAVE